MIPNLNAKAILKNKPLKKTMDYNFLRSKGIEFITELSGRLWTDHNSHDPGITFMEMICYALTDLSYRTNFPVKDLIALSEDEEQAWATKYTDPNEPKTNYNHLEKLGLFEAHEVLPTHPLTINDYRKLLLKIKGVRNAWLSPNNGKAETQIFADCKTSQLVFSSFEYKIKTGDYSGQSLLFKFPNINKYYQLRNTLKVVNIKNLNQDNRSIKFDLSLKKGSQPGIMTERAEFILDEDIEDLSKADILNIFKNNPPETFWQELWEHYEGLLRKDIKEIYLNGLYNVRLELDVDPEMGPLTERKLYYKIPFGKLKGASILFELNANLPKFPELTSIQDVGPVTLINDDENIWEVNLKLNINGKLYHIQNAKLYLLRDLPLSFLNATPNQKKSIIKTTLGTPVSNPENSILSTYWRKQKTINTIIKSVCCVLDAHRNLCEDFLNVDLVDPQHVSICMDIETKNNADIEFLSAKMQLAIEHYFNPPIKYYTLNELLEKNLGADEIFDGPYVDFDFKCPSNPEHPVFTKAGFVQTEELEEAELKTTLYTSDIINILMDFDEVLAVKNVMLRKIDTSGEPIGKSEKWCLNITEGKQPIFNASLSKMIFFKDEIPYSAKKAETEQTLKFLRAKSKKKAYVPVDQSFIIEKGEFRDLDDFYALQHDLPDIYGTSIMKLPKTVSSERLDNARNLKAYLLFFEQIFADYLQQLYNAKWLLSPEEIGQSYFSKYLKTEDISPLIDSTFEEEYYYSKSDVDPPYLEDDKERQSLYERDQKFLDRRNGMLDHLLARFSESFSDYTLMLYTVKGERVKAGLELIKDKTSFLEVYPKISRERGKAFNYRPKTPDLLWDSDNISGLERRFGLLMGIQNIQRRFLHCDMVLNRMLKVQKVNNQNKFFILCKSHNNTTLFRSKEEFPSSVIAKNHITKMRDGLRNESSYSLNNTSHLAYSYNGISIQSKSTFDTQLEYETVVESIFESYDILLQDETKCGGESNEGLFIIEHILLRPLSQDLKKTLLDVCFSEDCDTCGLEDPYSFRISIVLPYWPGRFINQDFRRHFEKTLRMEIPAHIMPKICWISNTQMKAFGKAYNDWLKLKSEKEIDVEKYNIALTEFISNLKNLRNVYPHATLHDCEEDGGDNPVQLGHTSLGSF